jgi:hypothetical protein
MKKYSDSEKKNRLKYFEGYASLQVPPPPNKEKWNALCLCVCLYMYVCMYMCAWTFGCFLFIFGI